ncbi:MAG: hypothetical protein AB1445_08510 [Bacillota bacterium]
MGARMVVAVIWGLAWVGFSATWTVFFGVVTSLQGVAAVVFGFLLAVASACTVGVLSYRASTRREVIELTAHLLRVALIIFVAVGAFLMLSWKPQLSPGTVALAIAYLCLAPLALGLAALAVRLGPNGSPGAAARAALVYLGVGLVLVFPVPALPGSGYNPVGVFFPVWGWGGPLLASWWGLKWAARTGPGDTQVL